MMADASQAYLLSADMLMADSWRMMADDGV